MSAGPSQALRPGRLWRRRVAPSRGPPGVGTARRLYGGMPLDDGGLYEGPGALGEAGEADYAAPPSRPTPYRGSPYFRRGYSPYLRLPGLRRRLLRRRLLRRLRRRGVRRARPPSTERRRSAGPRRPVTTPPPTSPPPTGTPAAGVAPATRRHCHAVAGAAPARGASAVAHRPPAAARSSRSPTSCTRTTTASTAATAITSTSRKATATGPATASARATGTSTPRTGSTTAPTSTTGTTTRSRLGRGARPARDRREPQPRHRQRLRAGGPHRRAPAVIDPDRPVPGRPERRSRRGRRPASTSTGHRAITSLIHKENDHADAFRTLLGGPALLALLAPTAPAQVVPAPAPAPVPAPAPAPAPVAGPGPGNRRRGRAGGPGRRRRRPRPSPSRSSRTASSPIRSRARRGSNPNPGRAERHRLVRIAARSPRPDRHRHRRRRPFDAVETVFASTPVPRLRTAAIGWPRPAACRPCVSPARSATSGPFKLARFDQPQLIARVENEQGRMAKVDLGPEDQLAPLDLVAGRPDRGDRPPRHDQRSPMLMAVEVPRGSSRPRSTARATAT